MSRPQRPYQDGTSTGPVRQWAANGHEYVTSSPIPLHTAQIKRVSGVSWAVHMISLVIPERVGRYGSVEDARQGASRAVNARTLVDMRHVYSGLQRQAMALGKCPKRVINQLCRATATGNSVWCPDHPNGGVKHDIN